MKIDPRALFVLILTLVLLLLIWALEVKEPQF